MTSGYILYQGSRDELNELCRKKDDEIARLRAERDEIIEMCAKVADSAVSETPGVSVDLAAHFAQRMTAGSIATAIRSLKQSPVTGKEGE